MVEKATAHIRRPHPFPVQEHWRIDCDCGWSGKLCRFEGPRELGRAEAEKRLNQLFIDHVPADRRQLYILVDQRPSREIEEDAEGNLFEPATGNFIMPEGKPCTLLGWWEENGLYRGKVRGFDLKDPVLELPIGEIRTAEGKVYRVA